MPHMHAGLNEMKKGHTIMFVNEDQLLHAFNADINSFQGIKTFGASKPLYHGFIFTKNSPLVPLFKKACMKMSSNGQLQRANLKWLGIKDIKEGGEADDVEILNFGQLFLPFAILVSLLGISIILLMVECSYNRFVSKPNKSNQSLHFKNEKDFIKPTISETL